MKLKDKCWVLGRNLGVIETTIAACTRGDCITEEFFITDAEAWAAEAIRARKEAERYENDAARCREREREAIERAKQP